MSTRPLPPPEVIAADPGPWSIVSHVRQTLAHRPDRRRPPTPVGLLIASPPRAPVAVVGLDPGLVAAGAGPLRVVVAAREPAWGLEFAADGSELRGVSPGVRRAWRLPGLEAGPEERPATDPAARLPAMVSPADLGAADLGAVPRSPGGELVAVTVSTGRVPALAILRAADHALVRWIVGARAAAWSPDGARLALGGDWGVMVAERA